MKMFLTATIGFVAIGMIGSCAGSSNTAGDSERERMKEELKREILAELQQKPSQSAEPQRPPQQQKRESEVKGPTGSVSGRILSEGQGLSECKVVLVRMVPSESLREAFRTLQEGAEFETVTDREGVYKFENVPAGSYRIGWQMKGETSWTRKLSEKPDVVARVGDMVQIKDIDMGKITLVPK